MRVPSLRRILGVLLLCGALVGCGQEDGETPTPNHRITLHNITGNVESTCAKQLTFLRVTPVSDGPPIEVLFVSNPNSSMDLDITIPGMGYYSVEVFEAEGGQSIRWHSMALALGGTTTIFVQGINTGYLPNSACNGIGADESSLVCGD